MKLNRNDKVMLASVIGIIVTIILLIIILINIWSSKEESKIGTYTYSGFETKVVEYYQKTAKRILKSTNINMLIKRLDYDFLANNNLSSSDPDGIKKYINKKNLFINNLGAITGYKSSFNEETGLLTIDLKYYNNEGFERHVYFLETEPYVYTVSFDDGINITSAKKNSVEIYNNIKFEFTLLETSSSNIKYNLKITNRGEEIVKFNFNNAALVSAILNDGSNFKLTGVVAKSEENYVINPNSYYTQELVFAIPVEKQGEIKSINFYNVLIGDEEHSFSIDF